MRLADVRSTDEQYVLRILDEQGQGSLELPTVITTRKGLSAEALSRVNKRNNYHTSALGITSKQTLRTIRTAPSSRKATFSVNAPFYQGFYETKLALSLQVP